MRSRTLGSWLLPAVLVLVGCDAVERRSPFGPCYHAFEDAVLTVSCVRDARSGLPIKTLFIHDLTVDGHPESPHDLMDEYWINVETVGEDTLRCTPPFTLGTHEGRFVFGMTAPGHLGATFQVDAEYAVFEGGCPSFNDEGTVVELTLDPVDLGQGD